MLFKKSVDILHSFSEFRHSSADKKLLLLIFSGTMRVFGLRILILTPH